MYLWCGGQILVNIWSLVFRIWKYHSDGSCHSNTLVQRVFHVAEIYYTTYYGVSSLVYNTFLVHLVWLIKNVHFLYIWYLPYSLFILQPSVPSMLFVGVKTTFPSLSTQATIFNIFIISSCGSPRISKDLWKNVHIVAYQLI